MPKKRKAPKSFEKPPAPKSSKFDVEETFDDSEDEFYAGRDKILLDESATTKRRQRIAEQEKDLQPSDEEILAYQDDATDVEDQDESDFDSDEEEEETGGAPLKGRAKRNNVASTDEGSEGESENEVWGTNRADYYGDDVIETEEQAKEEENEAKRLHQKQLKSMTEADFGFDQDEWTASTKPQAQPRGTAEKLPDVRIPESATEEQKLQILNSRYPEFLLLAEEYARLQVQSSELDEAADKIVQGLKAGYTVNDALPLTTKRDALRTYLAALSMYFAVLSTHVFKESDPRKITALAPINLHEHTVVQSLARARQLWDQVSTLDHSSLLEKRLEQPILLQDSSQTKAAESDTSKPRQRISKQRSKKISQPLDERRSKKIPSVPVRSTKIVKKTTKQDATKPLNNKKKPLGLENLLAQTEAADDVTSESDFGDEQPLTEEQYAEKARKRKSLRFYTSQLASKANKRGQASRVAGGDDDLPYKERQRDKHERLLREAEARGHQKPDVTDDFGGADDDYDNLPMRRDTNDEYYDALLKQKDQKKTDKDARAEAYAQAAKEGATVYEEETVGADGKRAITYAIAKNKGLAPKRNKDVRNPRVKKRKKYDEKMKKLGSMKQLYKGGEGRGGYKGELSGVNPWTVKSVKL